ncbi:MAG: glycosyltransferase [Luteitalea sp.]|nr:glycosyltransferase [Luteitalea sp.]
MDKRGPMSEVDLSVVIVNWNSAEYVLACVRSIVAGTTATAYEIIVVDNASFDGCEQQLAQEFPGVLFLQSSKNLGFGAANNLGVARSRGGVLLFLNPDTEVRKGAIDRLYAGIAKLSDAGVVGCRLLNTDGTLQTSCVQALPTVLNQILNADLLRRCAPRAWLWGTRALFSTSTAPVEVEAVSGACMMVRRQVFERVGGFSPAFFLYGEDLDFCARVGRAGFRNAYVGNCEVVHHGGGSARNVHSTFSVVMMCESVALLLRRLRGPLASTSYRVALIISACLRLTILAVTSPAWLMASGATSWSNACRKWLAILRWGLGLHRPALPHLQRSPDVGGAR